MNKCTFLDCANTEILSTVYIYSARLQFVIAYTHSLGTDTHT